MDECCRVTTVSEQQRRVVQAVLWINIGMFLLEAIVGLLIHSTSLLADSVDMLGDAIVYGFSLYVIGRGSVWLGRAALLKGVIMGAFGIGVLAHVVFKTVHGFVPIAEMMGVVGIMALAANLICLILLRQHRRDDINMRSAWMCSRNDVIGNAGVLVAALMVYLLNSPWPDIVIGLLIATLFVRSAISIIREASKEVLFLK
jgi:cation diffusion facilitator family transporter